MAEGIKDAHYRTGRPLHDCLRFVCDASYAVLPENLAHGVGEMKKNFWGGVRWLADKKIEWTGESLAAADRLHQHVNPLLMGEATGIDDSAARLCLQPALPLRPRGLQAGPAAAGLRGGRGPHQCLPLLEGGPRR